MPAVPSAPGTNVDEVADRVYRIHTPVPMEPLGGFSFNQYLVLDDEPLLFHTGPRRMFPAVAAAVAHVLPVPRLRWVAFSHVEADECGSLNEWLAAAPQAAPLCGKVAAMTSVGDLADRAPRALGHGEVLSLGRKTVRWMDAPHVPHGWECGYLFEETGRTLLCGDLFTQAGRGEAPLVETDILEPSERMRRPFEYFALGPTTRPTLEALAALRPTTMACMHGSAWRGDGAALLRALADRLVPVR